MVLLNDTVTVGQTKGSASRAEVAGGFEDWASIDERHVGVGCRRGRDAREARRSAYLCQGWGAPSIWSGRRPVRPRVVFSFLYFASPILIPIITALLLSMQLAPFVRLLEWVRVPRTLGSLIVVVA